MTERRSGKLSLLGLPTETLTAIFLRLGYIDLYTLRNTCLLFRTIIEQSNFDRVMLRQQYDPSLIEDIVNQHIRRSALYPVPGTVGAQSNRTPPSAFDVKLHPVLQSFGWAMCVEDYTIVYNWPLRNDMETIWEKENATTPPLRELHLRAGIYRFHLHTEDDRHCIQVHHVLDCLRKAVIETAGEDFELVRTLGCREPKTTTSGGSSEPSRMTSQARPGSSTTSSSRKLTMRTTHSRQYSRQRVCLSAITPSMC